MVRPSALSAGDMKLIRGSVLFHGVGEKESETLLSGSAVRVRSVFAGEVVFSAGCAVRQIGLVLEGKVHVEQMDYWGNRHILNEISPGDIFAEAYAIAGSVPLASDVVAREDGRILLADWPGLLGEREEKASGQILQNLLTISTRRNLYLTEKLGHMSRRTTREKLLSYLSACARRKGSREFDIPFNRQGLADYLAVERSAMSAELGRMRRDGLLSFRKNHFVLEESEPEK